MVVMVSPDCTIYIWHMGRSLSLKSRHSFWFLHEGKQVRDSGVVTYCLQKPTNVQWGKPAGALQSFGSCSPQLLKHSAQQDVVRGSSPARQANVLTSLRQLGATRQVVCSRGSNSRRSREKRRERNASLQYMVQH